MRVSVPPFRRGGTTENGFIEHKNKLCAMTASK